MTNDLTEKEIESLKGLQDFYENGEDWPYLDYETQIVAMRSDNVVDYDADWPAARVTLEQAQGPGHERPTIWSIYQLSTPDEMTETELEDLSEKDRKTLSAWVKKRTENIMATLSDFVWTEEEDCLYGQRKSE